MAQCEDLGVAFVARRDQPSRPAHDQVTECRTEVHRRKVSTDDPARYSWKHSRDGFSTPSRLQGQEHTQIPVRINTSTGVEKDSATSGDEPHIDIGGSAVSSTE